MRRRRLLDLEDLLLDLLSCSLRFLRYALYFLQIFCLAMAIHTAAIGNY